MLTNKNPVIDLVSGLLFMMKIRRKFPARAAAIVMQYNTV